MKLEELVNEEWKDSIKLGADTFEIFINPTKKEISSLINKEGEGIRYIIDGNRKKIYIFSYDLLHKYAADHLKIPYNQFDGIRIFGATEFPKKGEKLKIDKYDKLSFNSFLRNYGEESDWIWKYMKKPENLKEEWADSVKIKEETYEIFKNPTQKEINDLIRKNKHIRYIIDGNKKNIYIFGSELLHRDATKQLGISYAAAAGARIFGTIQNPKINRRLSSDNQIMINNFLRNNKGKHKWLWQYFQKPKLNEEWKDTIKMYRRKSTSGMKKVDIFVNPTTKEMLEAENKLHLRFIANFSDKKVYVFDPDVTHQEMAIKLGLSKEFDDYWYDTKLLGGVAKLSSGKFKAIEIHHLDMIGSHEHKFARSRRDWSFIDKYIFSSEFIKKRKKALEKEENIKKARRKIREQYEF